MCAAVVFPSKLARSKGTLLWGMGTPLVSYIAAFEHRPHPGGSGGAGAKKEPPRWPMALELLADMER